MPRAQPRFEAVDGLRVPLGGVNGYVGVRGKQGCKKNKYQGVTPRKKHRTGLFDSPLEAAIGLAQLHNLEAARRAKERRVQRLKCSGCGTLCEDAAAFQEHCGV